MGPAKSKPGKFAALPAADKWLLLRAAGWLAVARLQLKFLPFERLAARLSDVGGTATAVADPDTLRRVRDAVSAAAADEALALSAVDQQTLDPIVDVDRHAQLFQTSAQRAHHPRITDLRDIGHPDRVFGGLRRLRLELREPPGSDDLDAAPEQTGIKAFTDWTPYEHRVVARLDEIVKGMAAAYNVRAEIRVNYDYPPTVNEPEQTAFPLVEPGDDLAALVDGILAREADENAGAVASVRPLTAPTDWLGKLDAGSLKQKVAASIVAISSIHLLKAFVNTPQIPNDKLMWYVIIHMTFVLSALGMALVDRLNRH